MVKRLLIVMLVVMAVLVASTLGLAVPVMAEDTTGPVQFGGINLNGDTLYLPKSGSFAIGVGSTVATMYEGIVELRIEGAYTIKEGQPNMLGAGVGVKLRPLVEMLGGSWAMDKLNSSVGVVGLFNLNGAVQGGIFEPAIYVTIIGLQF